MLPKDNLGSTIINNKKTRIMTKKQIIDLCVEDSILAGSTSNPVRGKSAWEFVFPVRWEDFLCDIKAEAVVGNTLSDGSYYANPFPVYGEDLASEFLFDEDFFSFAAIWETVNAVTIKTAWSGYYYRFSEAANGLVALTFEGPRRAVGQQRLIPLCVQKLLGNKADENPFEFLTGMVDAEGNWFDADSVLSFYESEGWNLASCPGRDGWWERSE